MKSCIFYFLLLGVLFHQTTYSKPIGLLEKSSLLQFTPPIINKDYFALEYGFTVEKNIHTYSYNAYVLATLFEESTARADQLKAGALGFKAGVFLPIYVEIPLALKLSGGIARSVLHPSPILGKKEKTVSKNNMFLLDAGLLYQHQNFLISLTYQYNTIDYFTRKTFVTFGVNY